MDDKRLIVEVLDAPIGVLVPSELPKHVFTYLPDVPETHFVSLTMPVRPESYVWPQGLHPIFQMNLPEGAQKDLLRDRLGSSMPVTDIDLLALTGRQGIGRFTVRPYGSEKNARTDFEFAEIMSRPDSRLALQEALKKVTLENISGVMPKLPVTEKTMHDYIGGQQITAVSQDYILKTGRDDTPGIAINEYLCLSLAEKMGLPVAARELSSDGDVLKITRFDRDSDGTALGFEDFCALTGRSSSDKYDPTMEEIAKHIFIWCAESERMPSAKRLIEMLVLNLVVRNADAHAKNYALIYSSRTDVTLAPVFDVVTVSAYSEFAQSPFGLSMGGRRSWNLRKQLDRFCVERLNLPASTVSDAVEKAAVGMQVLIPEIKNYASTFPQFRETGKRMVKLWQEGLANTAAKGGVSVKVDFSTPKLSEEHSKKKSRQSKYVMNPEKMK